MQTIPLSHISMPTIVDALESGDIIVYPTETCYGIGCDATDEGAVSRIFDIKKREAEKSVLVVMPDIEMVKEYIVWNDTVDKLARTYWPGPLTIIGELLPDAYLADGVVADDGTVACRVSSHPFVYELTASLGRPIVSTSANISHMESPYDSEVVRAMYEHEDLKPDMLIDAGVLPDQSPSTIVRVNNGAIEVLRQGSLIIE